MQAVDFRRVQGKIGQFHLAGLKVDPAAQGAGHGLRLFHNFLEHKVAVAALVHQGFLQGNGAPFLVQGLAGQVGESYPFPGNYRHFSGFQKGGRAGRRDAGPQQRQGRRQIAAYNALPLPVGDDDAAGVAQAQGAELIRLLLAEGGDGLGTLQSLPHRAKGGGKGQAVGNALLNQMGNDFGIGIRGKGMAAGTQAPFQFQKVLDDAVMHYRHPAAAPGQGMGVGVGGRAVGRPTGMAQADGALRKAGGGHSGKAVHLAHGLAEPQPAGPVQHGNAGAVIAPVFQPLQALQQDGPSRFLAYIAHDAAHSASGVTEWKFFAVRENGRRAGGMGLA